MRGDLRRDAAADDRGDAGGVGGVLRSGVGEDARARVLDRDGGARDLRGGVGEREQVVVGARRSGQRGARAVDGAPDEPHDVRPRRVGLQFDQRGPAGGAGTDGLGVRGLHHDGGGARGGGAFEEGERGGAGGQADAEDEVAGLARGFAGFGEDDVVDRSGAALGEHAEESGAEGAGEVRHADRHASSVGALVRSAQAGSAPLGRSDEARTRRTDQHRG
ncbi:hypothetical protein [Actinomadura algeriensis]|uniref:Uncharacterized protein n=1 Tax=Actinomadura algeriensis TaxID=1679523 RepID=A0ABR9JMI3_9ACTN|nr:hypothetical protein [Actinomadura algeriensis]MBE1531776.1 hypothetical protein [Actinomadura algeriensis]